MKRLLTLLIFVTICISVITPSKVYAVDITVGATTWYAWWEMNAGGGTIDFDPEFMYGPALSVKFNDDFNLTFIYLYSKFDHQMDSSKPKSKMTRYDSDLALNYRLNDYFKVFAGIKYMGTSQPSGNGSSGWDQDSLGPGLGLSCTYPITENIYGLATLSGFYLWGRFKEDKGKENYNNYGINSTLALAYYIAPASTTISLGGRFQYFKVEYDKDDEKNSKAKFYGITLTATYTFSI